MALQQRAGSRHPGGPDKCSELAWYDLDALPENVIPYVRQALENFRAGVWFDSVGW